eukprot:2150083-Rhodomonas_salina.2
MLIRGPVCRGASCTRISDGWSIRYRLRARLVPTVVLPTHTPGTISSIVYAHAWYSPCALVWYCCATRQYEDDQMGTKICHGTDLGTGVRFRTGT